LPDDPLFTAVDAGRLLTADDYLREATRLLATPGARDTVRSFLHQWMATDRLASTSKDPNVYPQFTAARFQSSLGELDRYYDAVAWGPAGSLRGLFTSAQSFVDAPLAGLYGVTSAPATGFGAVTLNPTLRKGILTR